MNWAASDRMNAVEGLFALGGHVSSIDPARPDEYLFALSSEAMAVRLELRFVPWLDLGCPLAGTAGEPQLTGTGSLTAGSTNQIDLTGALPGAPMMILASFESVPAPYKGGILKANPADLLLPMTTGGGSLTFPFRLPAVMQPGDAFYLQAAIVDPGAVQGLP